MNTPNIKELIEKLADIEHQRWADWQGYCSNVIRTCPEEKFKEILKVWDRQIITDYKDLSEKEKESDREQVRRYLPLIEELIEKAWKYDDLCN